MAEMTERLGLLLGYELSKPAIICCGEGDKRIMRIRWRTEASYTPDCRILAFAAESGVSGDSHGCLRTAGAITTLFWRTAWARAQELRRKAAWR